jgi:hypothetical protein
MQNEIGLQKQIRRLQVCVGFLTMAMVVLIASAFSTAEKHDGVLRARGLIIEDDQGKERILIGSPIPGQEPRTNRFGPRSRDMGQEIP